MNIICIILRLTIPPNSKAIRCKCFFGIFQSCLSHNNESPSLIHKFLESALQLMVYRYIICQKQKTILGIIAFGIH